MGVREPQHLRCDAGTARGALDVSPVRAARAVSRLFIGSGASKFACITQYPQATLGVQGPFRYEARLYARYALAKNSECQIRRDFAERRFRTRHLLGLKDVLGEKYDFLVTAVTYEIQDPTIDSQIVKLKASGADVFVIAATPVSAAQSIRKAFEIGWRPMTFLSNVAVWISTVMEPAGVEAGTGIRHGRRQGSRRSRLEGRCRRQGLAGIHDQIRPRGRPARHQLRQLLQRQWR